MEKAKKIPQKEEKRVKTQSKLLANRERNVLY